MKIIVGVLLLLTLGCSRTVPVPDKAVKHCLDKDWMVNYKSSVNGVIFNCTPKQE